MNCLNGRKKQDGKKQKEQTYIFHRAPPRTTSDSRCSRKLERPLSLYDPIWPPSRGLEEGKPNNCIMRLITRSVEWRESAGTSWIARATMRFSLS